MPKLPKNLKISFEKSPPPRLEEVSPLMETVILEEPDIDALDDVIDELIPQFIEKDPPVVSEIFAPVEKKPKKPPSINHRHHRRTPLKFHCLCMWTPLPLNPLRLKSRTREHPKSRCQDLHQGYLGQIYKNLI